MNALEFEREQRKIRCNFSDDAVVSAVVAKIGTTPHFIEIERSGENLYVVALMVSGNELTVYNYHPMRTELAQTSRRNNQDPHKLIGEVMDSLRKLYD